jgi:leucyl-tRNA synthetase
MRLDSTYVPAAVEQRRQARWRELGVYATPSHTPGRRDTYVKSCAPFTSGRIHIGHARSYTIADAYARFRRMCGDAVLFSIGFDAFGLPAELAAIASGDTPAEWVERGHRQMIGQLRRLGFSYDWDRTFVSADEEQYRWSQWLFLALMRAGLVYERVAVVDWCDSCSTSLGTMQAEDEHCWRCGGQLRLVRRSQWFLRLSAYLDENERAMASHRDRWDDSTIAGQKSVLGRVDGVELELTGASRARTTLTCFTEYPEHIAHARFVMISPRHPELEEWIADRSVLIEIEALRRNAWQRSSRAAAAVPAMLCAEALIAANGTELRLVVSPAVDARFGPTAVLGIPSIDESDAAIAQRLGISETPVKRASRAGVAPAGPRPRRAVRYHAQDVSISRQRAWGAPIPVIHCPACDVVAVPEEELPVRLPREVPANATGNPLAADRDFVEVSCPQCGSPARRETDTLDCHFDALWMWLPICVPKAARCEQMFDHPECKRWLPGAMLVHGADGDGYFFDQRIATKMLRDIGMLEHLRDGEPFVGSTRHDMVTAEGGRKMSKHLGNILSPDELIDRYGADTVRLALLYAARPRKTLQWSDEVAAHCHKFLHNLWAYVRRQAAPANDADIRDLAADVQDTQDLRLLLGRWCDTAVKRVTADLEEREMKRAVQNVMTLFGRIRDFESRVLARHAALGRKDREAVLAACGVLCRLIVPFAPHAGEELWEMCGNSGRDDGGVPWPASTSRPSVGKS